MSARLISFTPDPERVLMRCARVSSEHSESDDPKLIKYLIREKHWSPFEMSAVCMEITTTRDISRQILRHRSFSFQECSQRYANVNILGDEFVPRQARTQDIKKRQRSHETADNAIMGEWLDIQKSTFAVARAGYNRAIALGIAKEVARVVLPEGLTQTKLYMNGTLRSWIHYCELRAAEGTQPEHRAIAEQCKKIIAEVAPYTAAALGWPAASGAHLTAFTARRPTLMEPVMSAWPILMEPAEPPFTRVKRTCGQPVGCCEPPRDTTGDTYH